ncbi:MAG: DNA/RNA helicase domain-containing protein [Bacteroidota bacterium]
MNSTELKVNHYDFSDELFEHLNSNHFAKNLWPVVYILSNYKTKIAYVGETTDVYSRMSAHLKNIEKSKLTSVHLLAGEKFNKSATLDIESNLIKYMSGDNVFKLLNANLGLANHNYYQKKEVYWNIFNSLWNLLRSEGIAKHSLDYITNSDLFKYSPYKSLSKDQTISIVKILGSLTKEGFSNIIVQGGAGTGKTILAIFLFKLLSSHHEDLNFEEFGENEKLVYKLVDQLINEQYLNKMALVVPMSSFRKTLKKVFRNIKGLNQSMVIGPSEVSKEKYDLLVVDEAHRLRRRLNLTNYKSFDEGCKRLALNKHNCSELDWVLLQSKQSIIFYDEGQSIKPTDTPKEKFDFLKSKDKTILLKLKSQFRVKGGNAYVEFVDSLLLNTIQSHRFDFKNYEFLLFDKIEEMITQIKKRNSEIGLSRLIAGFSWKWKSKNDKSLKDIKIENTELMWNSTPDDWINSKNSIDEVGCIHTTQGYDLNYAGVIFGNEISYDFSRNEIVVKPENYHDKNGKNTIEDINILKEYIVNIYKTIMLRGIKGTYIYVCDSNLKKYFTSYIPKFKSKRLSESIGFKSENIIPFENVLPFYDLKIAAGDFSEQQSSDSHKWISLPDGVKPSKELFICQVVGESMNKVIPNGSYCLFKKYTGGSRNGQIVLVQCNEIQDSDFGSSYTVKEYFSKKSIDENCWKHQSIVLKPLSNDEDYENIVLENDQLSSFRVIGTFQSVIK